MSRYIDCGDEDPLLDRAGQAKELGVHLDRITYFARTYSPGGRFDDPAHQYPTHRPDAVKLGRSKGVRRSVLLEWAANRPGQGAGRPRTRPVIPPGLTHQQWDAMQRLAAATCGQVVAVPSLVLGGLTRKGYTMLDGMVTEAGRALVDGWEAG